MTKLFRYALLLIIQLTASISVLHADPQIKIKGADSNEFQNALETWLDGNDKMALEAFAELARKSNPAAQVFLSRVASFGYLNRHLTEKMPRAERIALLRKPKGLSGQSWMKDAQATTPVATAFIQVSKEGIRADAIRALLSYGETAAAMHAIKGLLWSGRTQDVIDILTSSENVPRSASLILATAIYSDDSPYKGVTGSGGVNETWIFETVAARFKDEISITDYLTWQPINPKYLSEDLDLRNVAIEYSDQVPAFKPLVNFCKKHCADSVQTCVAAGAALAFSLPAYPFSSPVESLLQNETYWASSRIDLDVARRLPDMVGQRNYLSNIDSCLVPVVQKFQSQDQ